jgi:hypothetical protein
MLGMSQGSGVGLLRRSGWMRYSQTVTPVHAYIGTNRQWQPRVRGPVGGRRRGVGGKPGPSFWVDTARRCAFEHMGC